MFRTILLARAASALLYYDADCILCEASPTEGWDDCLGEYSQETDITLWQDFCATPSEVPTPPLPEMHDDGKLQNLFATNSF